MARYDAFVLRVWRSETVDDAQWAGRLEHLPDGATLRFGSLAALLAYLGAELAHTNPALADQAGGAGDNPQRKGKRS